MKIVDIYWSFRSPYSYLATKRLIEIADTYDVEVRPRPIYPMAIRSPEFFTKEIRPQWAPYIRLDTPRVAQEQGLPFARANPDPIVQDENTGEVAKEQPYIYRLTGLGILACEQSNVIGLKFLDEVSQLIWSGEPWNEGDRLNQAVARAGLDLESLDKQYEADRDRITSVIEANEKEHAKYHWGVPLMVFENEPFYGQDRLELLKWRLDTLGLQVTMPTRQIVTGHDENGKSVFLSDTRIAPKSVKAIPTFESIELWETKNTRLPYTGGFKGVSQYFPTETGTIFRQFVVHPEPEQGDLILQDIDIAEAEETFPGLLSHMDMDTPGMHTTQTVDYVIVLDGEVTLELDDGAEVNLSSGDCVVQNGTRHAWRNRSQTPARLAAVLVGAKTSG